MNARGFRWLPVLTLAALACAPSFTAWAQSGMAAPLPAVVQAPLDLPGPGDTPAQPQAAPSQAGVAASADALPGPGLVYVLALVATGLAGASRRRSGRRGGPQRMQCPIAPRGGGFASGPAPGRPCGPAATAGPAPLEPHQADPRRWG
jgi:hypothetical protein